MDPNHNLFHVPRMGCVSGQLQGASSLGINDRACNSGENKKIIIQCHSKFLKKRYISCLGISFKADSPFLVPSLCNYKRIWTEWNEFQPSPKDRMLQNSQCVSHSQSKKNVIKDQRTNLVIGHLLVEGLRLETLPLPSPLPHRFPKYFQSRIGLEKYQRSKTKT